MPQPRYFKEANSQFLLPGGYSPKGVMYGVVVMILGSSLGFPLLTFVGLFLGIYLSKKIGEDALFFRSFFWHVWTYKGFRYVAASAKEVEPKILVRGAGGAPAPLNEWVEKQVSQEAPRPKRRAA